MLELQREREYERWRLMTQEGLSAEEASAALRNRHPFKPAFPRKQAKDKAKTTNAKPQDEE